MDLIRLTHKLRTCLLIILLTNFPLTAAVLAQPIKQLTINYIEVSEAPEQYANRVIAYVTVTDASENPIPGLSTQSFEVNEDGKDIGEKQNLEVSQTADPMSVILAIDTSGSMQAKDKSGVTSMEAARRAAVDFINMLSKGDKVAIFSFNNNPILNLDFTDDHQAAVDAVKKLSAKYRASTCLNDTAIEAIKKAAEIPKGRRAIILLTDGKDEKGGGPCSIHTPSDVIDAATTKTIRVPIYTVGVGPKVDAKELRRFASFTGGRNLLATSVAELKGFYQKIANQLKNQYAVTYLTRSPSGEHSLVIKARHEGSQEQDLKRFLSPPPPIPAEPKVSFLRPTKNDKIVGTVDVRVGITPEKGIAKVRYYVNSALKKEYASAPFKTFRWDTADLSSGLHVLRVEAFNIMGRMGWAELTLKVFAPTIEIISPSPTEEIGGSVEVRIRIVSEEETAALRYFVDGVQIQEVTSGDFETFDLDAGSLPAGPHTLKVEVEDVNGRTGSAEIPLRIKAPVAGGILTIVLIVVLLLLTATLAGGAVWWMRFRKKEAETLPGLDTTRTQPREELEEIEDETMLFMDSGEEALPPRATLKVVKAPEVNPGVVYPILGTTKIGRSENNEIHIQEKSISRKHAEIYFDGGTFFIRDLGSKYGTMVDQRRISSEVCNLQNGTQIGLGPKVTFEFHCEDTPKEHVEIAPEEPGDYKATLQFPPGGDILPEKVDDDGATIRADSEDEPVSKPDELEEKTIQVDDDDTATEDHVETAPEEPVDYEATLQFPPGGILPEKADDAEATIQADSEDEPVSRPDEFEEKTVQVGDDDAVSEEHVETAPEEPVDYEATLQITPGSILAEKADDAEATIQSVSEDEPVSKLDEFDEKTIQVDDDDNGLEAKIDSGIGDEGDEELTKAVEEEEETIQFDLDQEAPEKKRETDSTPEASETVEDTSSKTEDENEVTIQKSLEIESESDEDEFDDDDQTLKID